VSDDPVQVALRAGDVPAAVALYRDAADRAEADGEIDQACFLLTQAYIHALHVGLPEADDLRARLARHGREQK
jgi:hypothetical protein